MYPLVLAAPARGADRLIFLHTFDFSSLSQSPLTIDLSSFITLRLSAVVLSCAYKPPIVSRGMCVVVVGKETYDEVFVKVYMWLTKKHGHDDVCSETCGRHATGLGPAFRMCTG